MRRAVLRCAALCRRARRCSPVAAAARATARRPLIAFSLNPALSIALALTPWCLRRRVEELQRSPQFKHACLVMTEKDYARQTDLFDAVFRWGGCAFECG